MRSEAELLKLAEARGWTPQHIERIIHENYRDHAAFCRRMKIRDERGTQVAVELTPAQQRLTKAIEEQERAGVPVRIGVLKARQIHMSVGAATHIFRRVAFVPGQHALVYADVYDSAENIWGYYDQFAKSYQPGELGIRQLKLVSRRTNEELTWEGNSYVDIRSAANPKSGRSASIRWLHLSEVAFWADQVTLWRGLMPCVPDDPGTGIIAESTANGMGGPFFEFIQRISDPYNKTGWKFIFFAWHEHPKYRRAVPDPHQFERSLRDEEHAERQKYGLSLEQLAWRRFTIADKFNGDSRGFRQEYPGCPEEAFLTSGNARFEVQALTRMVVIREPLQGSLEMMDAGTDKRIQFMPKDRGELTVYRKPVPGKRYVIGIDQAEGIDVNAGKAGSNDPDYSVAHVADLDTGEQVALLRLRMEPHPFADYVTRLARWYNWAYLVPESSPIGVGFIGELLRLDYPVHLMFTGRRDANDRRPVLLQEIGWRATAVSKQQLVSYHDGAIRQGDVHFHDSVTVQEHLTFVTKPNGKIEAEQGCHDDTVIAAALATIGLMHAPKAEGISPQRKAFEKHLHDDDDDEPGQRQRYGRQYRTRR